jgi:predicted nucleic acid-binding protein
MDLRHEIAKRVESLPPNLQQQILQFVSALSASAAIGQSGPTLRRFAAVATCHGMTLVTRDRHFQDVESLQTTDWSVRS